MLAAMLAISVPGFAPAQELAITFDDLPLNGTLPAGVTRAELVQRVVKVLKHYHVPQVYGHVA
jgi:peptidoglycan/xylan/chitin deacetylase (PgdA/CDA1 family)